MILLTLQDLTKDSLVQDMYLGSNQLTSNQPPSQVVRVLERDTLVPTQPNLWIQQLQLDNITSSSILEVRRPRKKEVRSSLSNYLSMLLQLNQAMEVTSS